MNKNIFPILLIILAIGTYFTFTRVKLDELSQIREVNDGYRKTVNDFETLIQELNASIDQYTQLNNEDKLRLDKMLPTNVDMVRLIIDVNSVATRHGISIKEIKTDADSDEDPNSQLGGIDVVDTSPGYNTATLSFKVESDYQDFVSFLRDLESSLRILDITNIELATGDESVNYDYTVELNTYWLKEIK